MFISTVVTVVVTLYCDATKILSKTKMSNSLSDAEKERYYAAFQMFDKDGMGRVSASNLGSMMKSLGKNPTSDELQGMHASI